MYLTTDIHTHTTAHTHSFPRSQSDLIARDGERERKILYRWKVKNKMEQITALKPHTRAHAWLRK